MITGPFIYKDLDSDQHKQIKKIFKEIYPGQLFSGSFRYPNDQIWLVEHGKLIIGYTMIHDETPYEFEKLGDKSINYIYNLCILPKHQNKKHGTMLLEALKDHYKFLTVHYTITNGNPKWFSNRGFEALDNFKGQYLEFCYPPLSSEVKEPETTFISDYYDPYENLLYLQV